MTARSAQDRLILARAALIKAEESRARKAKLRAERKQRGTVTRGRETDSGFLAYVRRQPCAARHLGNCDGPIEAAHIRYSDAAAGSVNPGMQRKNHDRHCNPLCRFHHQSDQHRRRERDFWASLGLDAYSHAADLFAAYQRGG